MRSELHNWGIVPAVGKLFHAGRGVEIHDPRRINLLSGCICERASCISGQAQRASDRPERVECIALPDIERIARKRDKGIDHMPQRISGSGIGVKEEGGRSWMRDRPRSGGKRKPQSRRPEEERYLQKLRPNEKVLY